VADRPRNTQKIMENSSVFDLNDAMRRWRRDMSASPALRAHDLDELEFHLRDSVALLQTKGLSAREAFWVAKSRVGTNDALDCEFEKVNAEQVWLNRALWMVIGSVAIGALFDLVSTLVTLSAVAVHRWTGEDHFLGLLSTVVYFVAFIGLLSLVWRSGRRGNGVVWQIRGWMRIHRLPQPSACSCLSYSTERAIWAQTSLRLRVCQCPPTLRSSVS